MADLVFFRRLTSWRDSAPIPHGAVVRHTLSLPAAHAAPPGVSGAVLWVGSASLEYAVTPGADATGAVWVPAWGLDTPTPIPVNPGEYVHVRSVS